MKILFLFSLGVLGAIGSAGIADLLGFYSQSTLFIFELAGGVTLPTLFLLADPDLRRNL